MKKIIWWLSSYILLFPLLTRAKDGPGGGGRRGDDTTPPDIKLPNPLEAKTIEDLLKNIATFLVQISVPIATIMIIYGAFQILTAADNPEKVKSGKKTIFYTLIGLAIILLFNVILALIKQLLGVQP